MEEGRNLSFVRYRGAINMKKTQINIRITQDLRKKLDKFIYSEKLKNRNFSQNKFIEGLILNFFENK